MSPRISKPVYNRKPTIEPVVGAKKWVPYEERKVAHRNIPKGKTQLSKGVRPKMLTYRQAENFVKTRENYNRRQRRHAKTLMQKFPGMSSEELITSGLLEAPMRKGLFDIRDKRHYQTLMRAMKIPSTKKWVAEKTANARRKYARVIESAFGISGTPELNAIIRKLNTMSIDDIAKWQYDNKELVTNIFDEYSEGDGFPDEDSRTAGLNKVLTTLGLGHLVES